jgi:phosphatidylinositol alpha-1,6-mannosyltransferase
MSAGLLAAITLHPRGGGVAAVSRLLWRVLRDQAPESSRLVTLLEDDRATSSVDSSRAMRVRFGARVAKAQLVGDSTFVLYSHLSLAQVQAYIPAAVRRPYAVFLHGIEAWRPLSRPQRAAIEGAKVLICNSQYTADRIADAHPWVGKINPCPLALAPADAQRHVSGAATIADDLGPHVVLVVARMSSKERYKGHDQLLEAWPAVRARIPDARLVFAGAGDDVARLRAKAAALGLAPSVMFPGFVSDAALESLYRHAAVFAMPSRDEGFGLVYLEAMSHRLPCLGSTHDAARETIEGGVTGLLVPQDDVAGLAGALARLLEDETLRREMGRRGYDRLHRHFSYPMFRDRLTGLLSLSPAPIERVVLPAASS